MEVSVHAVSWWLGRRMFRNRSVPSRSDVASHCSDLCHRINVRQCIRDTLTEGVLHLSICRAGVVFEITFPSSLLFSVQQSPFHRVESPCARSCPFKYCIRCRGKKYALFSCTVDLPICDILFFASHWASARNFLLHCVIFLSKISVFQTCRTCQASTTLYGVFSRRRYGFFFPRLVFVVFSGGKVALGRTFPLVLRLYLLHTILPLLHIHISTI